MSANCDVIVIFLIYGQFRAIQKPNSGCIIWKTLSLILTFVLPLSHFRNAGSLSLLYRYYFGRCLSELTEPVPLTYSRRRSTRYSDRLHDFPVTIRRCCNDVYVNSFFLCTTKLWNSVRIECFPLT